MRPRRSFGLLLIALLVALVAGAHADCLVLLSGSSSRPFSRAPDHEESAGLRGFCTWLGMGMNYGRVNGRNGLWLELSGFIPLNIGHPERRMNWPLMFYLDPGAGYRMGGGGPHGYSFFGGGMMWPIRRNHDRNRTDVYGTLEVRQRFRFGAPYAAGTQLSFGIVLVVPD